MSPDRVSVREERGRSFQVEVQEPAVESLVREIWRLRASEAVWRVWEGV